MKRRRRRFLDSLLVLFVPFDALAQGTGRVVGVVRSADSTQSQPIQRAQVPIVGTQLGAISDASGRFTIRNVPAGQHVVRATALGYSPLQQPVTVTAGADATVNLSLPVVAYGLRGVVVVGYTDLEHPCRGAQHDRSLPAFPIGEHAGDPDATGSARGHARSAKLISMN